MRESVSQTLKTLKSKNTNLAAHFPLKTSPEETIPHPKTASFIYLSPIRKHGKVSVQARYCMVHILVNGKQFGEDVMCHRKDREWVKRGVVHHGGGRSPDVRLACLSALLLLPSSE